MKNFYLSVLLSVFAISLQAQEEKKADALKQANNPLANMTALNFQNYYIPKLTNAPSDASLNNAWVNLPYAMANRRLLIRVSIPLSTTAIPDGTGGVANTSGPGGINAFLLHNFCSDPSAKLA